MLKHTWIIIYGVFYTAAAAITFGKLNGKDKSVNLALETVFEFGDEDKKADVNILNKVQKFIGKVKKVIENSNGRRHLVNDNKNRFTGFIVDLIRVLKQYDDHDLEQFVIIVSDEMKNHRGSKFHELTETIGVQEVLANKLVEIKYEPASAIRKFLEVVANKIDEETYLKSEIEILNAINSVYTEDSTVKLNTFLTDLDDYRLKARKNIDLSKIISEGLRSILFDHYTNLHVDAKTSLLSSLNDILKKFNAGVDKVTPKHIHSKPLTKTTNILRTSRQMYVEKDLDLKYIKSAFKKWISDGVNKEGSSIDKANKWIVKERNKDNSRTKHSEGRSKDKTRTPMTKRPLNVPTTRKLSYEYDDALRSYKSSKREIKHRFSKVSNEESTPKYKKRKTETTKEYRTLRQMYVEKNIDLKYDPDAYEHLTTSKKDKTKKISSVRHFNSPTTRKAVKNAYKEEENDSYESQSNEERTKKQRYEKPHETDGDSDETGSNPNKKDKAVESILSDFMIELSTEVHAPSITKRPNIKLTKMARFFGQTFLDRDLDYGYDKTPEFRSNTKKRTFRTLYPTFVIDWSTTQPRNVRKKTKPAPEHRVRKIKHGSAEDRELVMEESGNRGVIRDSKKGKDLDYSIEVRKEKYLERSRKNKQNYRHKNEHHQKDYSRVARVRLRKPTERNHENVPILQRQDRESLSGKIKMSRAPLILAKQYRNSHNVGGKQYRTYYSQAPRNYDRGLSIQADDDMNRKRSNRRFDNPDTALKIDGNKQFLKRLQRLENELELVKTRIKNDTNAVKDLNNNRESVIENKNRESYSEDELTTLQHSDNRKVTQLQKIITNLNSKPDLGIDTVTQLKSINSGGFNMEIPEIHKTNNYVVNKQSFDLGKDKVFTEYRSGAFENPLKSYNTISDLPLKAITTLKEDYVPNFNNKEHGRKAFPNIKNIEMIKPDDNLYEKPSNFDSNNNTPKKNIEAVASKMNLKAINENDKASIKDKQDKALYFRTDDDEVDDSTLNVTAYETLKNEYDSGMNLLKNYTVQNQTETKPLNNPIAVVFEEEQLKQINDDNKVDGNITKDELDNHVASVPQLNSTRESKRNEKVDYSGIAFRVRMDDIPDIPNTTMRVDLSTKRVELREEIKSIVTDDKIVTQLPVANDTIGIVDTKEISDHSMKRLLTEIGGHLAALPDSHAGNVVQRSVTKDPADVNTMKNDLIKNETLSKQQIVESPNILRVTNLSLTF